MEKNCPFCNSTDIVEVNRKKYIKYVIIYLLLLLACILSVISFGFSWILLMLIVSMVLLIISDVIVIKKNVHQCLDCGCIFNYKDTHSE